MADTVLPGCPPNKAGRSRKRKRIVSEEDTGTAPPTDLVRQAPTAGSQNDKRQGPDEHVDHMEILCEECSKIDFDELFSIDSDEFNRRHKTVELWLPRSPDECSLCHFLTRTLGMQISEKRSRHYFQIDSERFSFVNRIKGIVLRECLGRHLAVLARSAHVIPEPSLTGRLLDKNIDYNVLREWLRYCDKHHTRKYTTSCKGRNAVSIPGSNVIDCVDRKVIPLQSHEYVTLSYVWGSSTTLKNEHATEDGRLPRELPAVIEDSISVVLALGQRYLWVDRYCVNQSDPEIKHIQIKNMGSIYEQSTWTIIAAAGDGPDYGLPGVGQRPRAAQPRFSFSGSKCVLVPFGQPADAVRESVWASRAWTYQEGLLARRRLVFTETQVYFQCGGMYCLESLKIPLDAFHVTSKIRFRKVDLGTVFPLKRIGNSPVDFAARANEYHNRELTYSSDVLNAFQGILTLFTKMKPHPVWNIYGVPLHSLSCFKPATTYTGSLLNGLAWRGRQPYLGADVKRRFSAPSWTWLGWTGFDSLDWRFPRLNNVSEYEFRPYAEVDIDVGKDDVVPWEAYHKAIQSGMNNGHLPFYLRMRGWVYERKLSELKREYKGKIHKQSFIYGQVEHRLADELFGVDGLKKVNKKLWEYLVQETGNKTRLVFMLLFTQNAHHSLIATLLLLRHLPKDNAYERVKRIRVPLDSPDSDETDFSLRVLTPTVAILGGAELQWKEIRLG